MNTLIYYMICIMMLFSWICPAKPQLTLIADAASYRYDDNAAYVEIYYQLKRDWGDQTFFGTWTGDMKLRIYRNDSLYTQTDWKEEIHAENPENEVTVSGRAYFLGIDGSYTIRLMVKDAQSDLLADSLSFDKTIRAFRPAPCMLSDIELATDIQFSSQENKDHPFYKNALMVTPNVSRVYSVKYPILYYYSEIYSDPNLTEQTTQFYLKVTDQSGQAVQGIPPVVKTKTLTNTSVVEMGQIGLFSLATGEYTLLASLSDSNGNLLSSAEKTFYMFRGDSDRKEKVVVDKDALFAVSPFIEMDKNEIKEEMAYAQILMNETERRMSKKIKGLDGKRQYLFDFWLDRDPNSRTVKNEAYEAFKDKVQEANQKFRTMRREGWKTDRGRVYVQYGAPSDIDRYPSSASKVPYEIWQYNDIEGGVQFVFADLSGYKEYQLIHSTKQGEVYNPEYESIIYQGY